MKKIKKREPSKSSNSEFKSHVNSYNYFNVIFVHWQYIIFELTMLYFLNEWCNQESWENGPPPQNRVLNPNHISSSHHDYVNVIFVHLQCDICLLPMLYFLNGGSNQENWEKMTPKSGYYKLKSHFKQSLKLCQCHICASAIFYLCNVNVIFSINGWSNL